ncbi:MAG: hypothetical protein QOH42_2059, partial [Blastocatellia bacterium]|nr:hypothetical protein [Blastocatellia bacterium]
LNDLVADNLDKFDITESESLLIGRDFGITTDIETGPNGDLFVVSNTNSSVYEISGKQPLVFTATLNGAQETPPNNSTAVGTATLLLSPDEKTALVSLNYNGLSSAETAAHIHGPAAPGTPGAILFPLPNGGFTDFLISPSATDVQNLKNGQLYINVHSSSFLNGEIRGQFQTVASASTFQFNSAGSYVTENAGSAVINVTRLGNTSAPATIDYATSNGTATSPSDYLATSGTLHFSAGETFKTFSIQLVDDLYVEGNETVKLSLTNPSAGSFFGSPNLATLTIVDNDVVTASPPQLILEESGPDANQATAFDATLFLRDPFHVQSPGDLLNPGPDRNTRVVVFGVNLKLNQGETASAVVVHLVDNSNQSYDVTAEDVRVVTNFDFAQITFRLPDNLAAGTCAVTVKAHGQVSNTGAVRIVLP